MAFDLWHPLDGNMIAADGHYSSKEDIECPDCGEEMEEDEDGVYCPHCGFTGE